MTDQAPKSYQNRWDVRMEVMRPATRTGLGCEDTKTEADDGGRTMV